jgi:type I site-specific restriction-modification system R (restriction) subunit
MSIDALPASGGADAISPEPNPPDLKEDTFVLDFVNERDEIREAFKTYYEGAEVGEDVDPAQNV